MHAEGRQHTCLHILPSAIISKSLQGLATLQCSQVFPQLYLPLMTEGNLRTLRPWRMYIPTPSWFRHRCASSQRMSDPSVGFHSAVEAHWWWAGAEQLPKLLTEKLLNWCRLRCPATVSANGIRNPGEFISTDGQFVGCQQRCHWIQMQLALKFCTPLASV